MHAYQYLGSFSISLHHSVLYALTFSYIIHKTCTEHMGSLTESEYPYQQFWCALSCSHSDGIICDKLEVHSVELSATNLRFTPALSTTSTVAWQLWHSLPWPPHSPAYGDAGRPPALLESVAPTLALTAHQHTSASSYQTSA